MPVAKINDIEVNYKLEGEGPETIVLINGLADDLETWAFQAGDFLAAGYRVLLEGDESLATDPLPIDS
jgi:pimeloyl-ACP methyl ester carboxylesterase